MTNGEHSKWLGNALQAIPSLNTIGDSLRRANAIACYKELHSIGEIDDASYKKILIEIMKLERFEIS